MVKTNTDTKTYEDGIKYMKNKMLKACLSGKCLEIQGRVYYIIDDITHMRMIFDDIEKENS